MKFSVFEILLMIEPFTPVIAQNERYQENFYIYIFTTHNLLSVAVKYPKKK
jgi:hypothetical protein